MRKRLAMRWLRRSMLATLLALAAVVAFVLAQAFPSTEAVRLRNALLISDVRLDDFNWPPDRPPTGFLQETEPIPALISSRAKEIAGRTAGGDLEIARALASHLIEHARDAGPIQSLDPETNYRAIVTDGRGYCADYIDTFIALALAAEVPVRAWAFSFDGFGGHGHIVAEIFDRRRGKWLMLDVFNNVYPVDQQTEEPLSALELRDRLRSAAKFVRIGPGRLGYPIEAELVEYYERGLSEWYLWFGNNVVSRGDQPLVRATAAFNEPLGELLAIGLDTYPKIVPIRTTANAGRIARMANLRRTLLLLAGVAIALSLMLLLQLAAWWWLRAARDRAAAGPGGSRG